MTRMNVTSHEEVEVPNRPLFAGSIRTDGYGVDCIFTRRKLESLPQLAIEDFTTAELDRTFHLWGVDPGITEIFVASDGHGQQTHQIRRCSTAEFYHNSGVKKSAAKMLAMKQQTVTDGRTIADIERDLPSRKSSHKANIIRYAQELSQDLDSMLNFTMIAFPRSVS
ncbi:uncharacterized protein BYT42DRAFT_117534 [Radiomyces spectabilis]|uniref:uncharacterized protein n=1 Tax=Radiomyces spectabilis TaxID=64574 RepID=UPI002220BE45|nr:uncharacterized protein BYT42DRAFT_117534 [Radiomyces spectabilis]KAI8369649.1 hypothetical protein BYT42DRAFT_117534 [Radiomyces spectabilis]